MKKLVYLAAVALVALGVAGCSDKKAEQKYIVQVSMGEWGEQYYSTEDVIAKIEAVSEVVPLDKVMVGWMLDPEPYKVLAEYLHGKGIQFILYLPVFSETEGACDNKPAVDIYGKEPSDFMAPQGSGFHFNCPSDPLNIENVIGLYENNLTGIDFDGVFLDRIRTQSFLAGVSGVLNCCCETCSARFAELGVDLAEVKAEWEDKGDKFFSVTGYSPKGGFSFENPVAEAYFKAKGIVVSEGVAKVADYFRNRGMIVGMDLFAPLVAQFVGQDYEYLAQHADFFKPMLYRRTDAPAGIGYEYDLLKASVPDAEGYGDIVMDVDFLNGQLDALEGLPCEMYPGIEIVYDEKIVRTDPEYILESLRAIRDHGFKGAVVSWNIMQAPMEHVKCLSEL